VPRTSPGIRTSTAGRLAQERPEWQAWIGLLELVWSALEQDHWEATLAPALKSGLRSQPPLLHGQSLPIDADRAGRLLRDLVSAASAEALKGGRSLQRLRPTASDAVDLITAAVVQDLDSIERLAAAREVEAGALVSLANLAALPLLQTSGRLLQNRLPEYWAAGYCPICAAWPTLAERRGLDRSRRLRCGRCAADWEVQWLYCVYCGERDHTKLATLVEADSSDMLKVETCASCRGYLKSIARLQSFPPLDLILQDLETVELDLVALERGYQRPPERPFDLSVRITHHASR